MKYSLFLLSIFIASNALAEGTTSSSDASPKGVAVVGAIGSPTLKLSNPDGSDVYYSGVSLWGRGLIPIVEARAFRFDLLGSLRFTNANNKKNNDAQKEEADILGYGGGAEIGLYSLFFGLEYLMNTGKHYSIGAFNNSLIYHYNSLNYYIGFEKRLGIFNLGIVYSSGSGSIPTSETNLSKATPVSDSAIWLQASYSFKKDFFAFIADLLK